MDVVIGVTVVQPLGRNNRIYCADCLWRSDWEFSSSLLEVWIESVVRFGKQVTRLNISITQLGPNTDVTYRDTASST